MIFNGSGGQGCLMAVATFYGSDDGQELGSGGKEEDADTTNGCRVSSKIEHRCLTEGLEGCIQWWQELTMGRQPQGKAMKTTVSTEWKPAMLWAAVLVVAARLYHLISCR
jgi:hypothetical protein